MFVRSYRELGDEDAALRYFSLALEVRDDSYGRAWRSVYYWNLGDCKRALEDVDALLGIHPMSCCCPAIVSP